MNMIIFDTQLLPDGHLYCPEEFAHKKNVQFKVIVLFEESELEASSQDLEQASIEDKSDDFLSQEELNYYLTMAGK